MCKAPRARGARSPHTRDDVRRVVERIDAGGVEEDEEGGELPSVGGIVDARPPAAREGAAEEGEGDAPESYIFILRKYLFVVLSKVLSSLFLFVQASVKLYLISSGK